METKCSICVKGEPRESYVLIHWGQIYDIPYATFLDRREVLKRALCDMHSRMIKDLDEEFMRIYESSVRCYAQHEEDSRQVEEWAMGDVTDWALERLDELFSMGYHDPHRTY